LAKTISLKNSLNVSDKDFFKCEGNPTKLLIMLGFAITQPNLHFLNLTSITMGIIFIIQKQKEESRK